MRFFEIVSDEYIIAIGRGDGGSEITEAEYNDILAILKTKPQHTDNTDYRLRQDMTWEEFLVVHPDPSGEQADTDEALSILLGGTE